MISASGGLLPTWSVDGKRLFYMTLNGELMAVDVPAGPNFQHGAPQRLFGAGGTTPTPLNQHPAGDRFLVLRPSVTSGPPPPFTLVLNWMAKLEP